MGYTHRISWLQKGTGHLANLMLPHSFPTTRDAVLLHLRTLRNRKDITDLKVEKINA